MLTALVLATTASIAPLDLDADLRRADRLFDRQKWSEAHDAYAAIVEEDDSIGEAWFRLGYCAHALEDYEGSRAAGERAKAFPEFEPTARYNLACALALLGRQAEAETEYRAALDAGFFDYDNIEVDTDLATLRAAGKIELPERREYTDFRFRNGVECAYEVILPKDHDPDTPTPAVVCFAPGSGGPRCADWFTANVLGDGAREAGAILVVLVAPDRGWQNHPAHHALEGLLKEVRKEHAIDGDFHALGFAEGARSAATYSRMSRKFFQSLTTVSSRAWSSWEDPGKSYRDGMPVKLIVGENDPVARAQAERVHASITERENGRSELVVLPDAGRTAKGLTGERLVEAVLSGVSTRANSSD